MVRLMSVHINKRDPVTPDLEISRKLGFTRDKAEGFSSFSNLAGDSTAVPQILYFIAHES